MKLHTYFRSSAAYRVRIALNLKDLDYASQTHHLRQGAQRSAQYLTLNPQGLVPTLEVQGAVLTQSLAIIEYLDETHPEPPLLPDRPLDRAWVRAIALHIACDIHPLNNLRVLEYLEHDLNHEASVRNVWYRHWIAMGFTALEAQLAHDPRVGRYCYGERPTLADICLVPQVANARRFGCDLSRYPTITRIDEGCRTLPAFARAAPEAQPDAE